MAVNRLQRLGVIPSVCLWPVHQYRPGHFVSNTQHQQTHQAGITLELTILIGSTVWPATWLPQGELVQYILA